MATEIIQPPPYREGSIEDELIILYKRHATVENLIRSLDEYGRCHAGQFTLGGMRTEDISKWAGLLAS